MPVELLHTACVLTTQKRADETRRLERRGIGIGVSNLEMHSTRGWLTIAEFAELPGLTVEDFHRDDIRQQQKGQRRRSRCKEPPPASDASDCSL